MATEQVFLKDPSVIRLDFECWSCNTPRMLQITTFVLTPFSQNTRILADRSSKAAVVVDPGGEVAILTEFLQANSLTCKEIWLTHSHIDHCGGVAELLRSTSAKLLGHKDEQFLRAHVREAAMMFGLSPNEYENCPEPDQYIAEGDELRLGDSTFRVLFTPGHSPGHVSFYNAAEGFVVSGDALFRGSVGRVDLPGSDGPTLRRSIREKLATLPPETRVLSGHGPDTEIGIELRSNPFLQSESW